MNAHPAADSVVVAVPTYKRNQELVGLLSELARQVHQERARRPVRVLVVDNDPGAAAGPAVRDLSARVECRVDYVHEPRPGISAARNRALLESAGEDLLLFIDDDERPTERWLSRLVGTYLDHGRPAAVIGPVVSTFPADPEPWLAAGEFFRRRRMRTGTPLTVGATNNLLLDLRQVAALGLSFDEGSGLTGGEDTLFTRQVFRAGARLVWCDEAVVHDVVPPERLTRSWVLRRALSSGNSWSLTEMRLSERGSARWRARSRLSMAGAVRAVLGATRTAGGLLVGSPRHQAKGARTAARGVGMVAGAWGLRYREYKR